MRKEYHCLIAGLPELLFDTAKLSTSVADFKSYLREELSAEDFQLIELYFWRYDNENLLILLQQKDEELNVLGNLSREDFDIIFSLVKDDALSGFGKNLPSYFEKFIIAYKNEIPIFQNKSWENQLTDLYFNFLLMQKDEFIKDWYSFELDLTNILTASKCRMFQIETEPELIGNNELTVKLLKNSARDFGIGNEFPKVEQILRSIDETDFLEKEKKIDQIKWELLDERTFFHYFTVEKIFAYVLKLEMIERWLQLDKQTGEELLKKLLIDLESNQKLPEEFSQK